MLRARCVLALLALALVPPTALVAGRVDYCNRHTFGDNSTYMQYNKELIEAEYAVQNQFKAIHCCGKGYRSIEWLKDGVAYPWASAVSNLILYPEAANQTLYTQRAGSRDTGNYTCRMRNDTHHIDHTIALQVAEMPTDTPRATVTPNDKTVALGSEVRFYCEAFVGRVNLADAHSDIRWRRVRPDQDRAVREQDKADSGQDKEDREQYDQENDHERASNDRNDLAKDTVYNFKEILTKRENEDVVGAYLYIASVRPEDYGQYVCTVRSNDVVSEMPVTLHFASGGGAEEMSRAVPWRALLVCALLGGAALLSAAVLYARCWPRVALAARLLHARRAPAARLSDNEYDVLVVCTAVDGELTRGALLPTLALKYHYRTAHLQLTTQPDTWYEQISERVRACRSLVCVLSPTQHTPAQLLTALKQLRALPVPPVIVLLQDLPRLKREAKDERGECLVSLLRRTKLLAWRHVQDRAFWTSLRLALPLPPPRHTHCVPARDPDARSPTHASSRSDKMKVNGVGMVELARGSRNASRSSSLDALV